MKINGISLKDVMLNFTLGQFQCVPQEADIDHSFSESFEENIQRTNKKSQNVAWRFWQSPVKRTLTIVAIIIALIAVLLASFGFRQRPHIPRITETYYIPTYEPEGFILLYRERYMGGGITYCWERNYDELIEYHQIPGKKDSSSLVDDGTSQKIKSIHGRSVEISKSEEWEYCSAVWHDDKYSYWITIDGIESDPYVIVEDLIDSLVPVCGNEKSFRSTIENKRYSICEKDGNHILVPNSPITYDTTCCSYLNLPNFTSIAEMRHGIIAGPLSESELASLAYKASNTEGEIVICDPDELYECTTPEEFDLEYISWYGRYYIFQLIGETSDGGVTCFDQETYSKDFQYNYQDFLTNSLITVTEQTNTPDRSATVYYCKTSVAKLKYICYEISVGNKKMYVQEEYLLESQNSDYPVSDHIPSSIQFWGTENGVYFNGYLYDLTERPSVEWLSQFGLVPYKD